MVKTMLNTKEIWFFGVWSDLINQSNLDKGSVIVLLGKNRISHPFKKEIRFLGVWSDLINQSNLDKGSVIVLLGKNRISHPFKKEIRFLGVWSDLINQSNLDKGSVIALLGKNRISHPFKILLTTTVFQIISKKVPEKPRHSSDNRNLGLNLGLKLLIWESIVCQIKNFTSKPSKFWKRSRASLWNI